MTGIVCVYRPSWFVSTLQFLLAMTHFVPAVIVSVPSEYQSAASVNHSVAVKHEPSKMNGVLYGK